MLKPLITRAKTLVTEDIFSEKDIRMENPIKVGETVAVISDIEVSDRVSLPDIFFELSSIPFLSCRLLSRKSSGSKGERPIYNEVRRTYSFKIRGARNLPRMTLIVNGDGSYEKFWGSRHSNISFYDIMNDYILDKKVQEALCFYIDIL